jgi:2-keto-4-pentenoate hydratase/2-oxohepta-3-ene-1,7-dioic acid hydratase in catechol pathway
MFLLRYGPPGHERPALLDPEGGIRDLGHLLHDFTPTHLSPEGLRSLRAIDPRRLPAVSAGARLGVPWSGVGKVVAVGLNYSDHAQEAGMALPEEPILFAKWTTSLCGPDDPTLLPPGSVQLDWEVELGMVVGTRARHVPEDRALEYVAGYCMANDVSERSYQIARSGGQWSKGKGFDSFGPVGPYLVTADEVADPQDLELWLDVNGEPRQRGSTSRMVFSCARLLSYCSRVMTLEPGDLILTGTPPGVGMGMKPPQFLRPGDVVELGIGALGRQRQRVVQAH